MSFATVPAFELPTPPNAVAAAPTITNNAAFDINGSGQWVAFITEMPETKTIDKMFFSVGSATTGCTVLCRVETVDTSTGLPSGTLVNANASQSAVIASGAAKYEVTFPGSFSIPKGTLIAILVIYSSGAPSAIRFDTFSDDNNGAFLPYSIDFDASASLRDNIAPLFGLSEVGGNGVSFRFMWPLESVATETYQATSTPDTRGNKITLDAPMRISGFWSWIDLDSTATFKIYDSDGVTVLASYSMYESVPPSTSATINRSYFSSSIELNAGSYYIVIEATGGATIGLVVASFYSASWRYGSPMAGGKSIYASCTQTPTGTGSWTETDTKQAFLGLIVDGVSDGASSSVTEEAGAAFSI